MPRLHALYTKFYLKMFLLCFIIFSNVHYLSLSLSFISQFRLYYIFFCCCDKMLIRSNFRNKAHFDLCALRTRGHNVKYSMAAARKAGYYMFNHKEPQ